MDYPFAEFGDFSFSRFGFIVRTDRENHIHTDRIREASLTDATAVGVRNDMKN